MKNNLIEGAPLPPRDRNVYWVETVDAGEKQRWTIYSPKIWAVYFHWQDGCNPCYEPHKHCVGGHDPATLRWKGYLFGFSNKKNKNCFLQLTYAAAEMLVEQIPTGCTFRAMVIDVQRTNKKKGRLLAGINEYITRDANAMPPDLNPRASIFNHYKLRDPGHKFSLNPSREMVLPKPPPEEGGALIHLGVS